MTQRKLLTELGQVRKGSQLGADDKFELGHAEFEVSEEDKQILWRRFVDQPVMGQDEEENLAKENEGASSQCDQYTMTEDKEKTAIGFENLELQVTLRKTSVVKWWAWKVDSMMFHKGDSQKRNIQSFTHHEFTCFKVWNSMSFGKFTALYNHHHNPILRAIHLPTKIPCAHLQSLPIPTHNLKQPNHILVPVDLPIQYISYKWNETI